MKVKDVLPTEHGVTLAELFKTYEGLKRGNATSHIHFDGNNATTPEIASFSKLPRSVKVGVLWIKNMPSLVEFGDASKTRWHGEINIWGAKLTTLEGCPNTDDLFIRDCPIHTLVGLTEQSGSISFSELPLIDLQGVQTPVRGGFHLHRMSSLISLNGVPNEMGFFRLLECPKITNFKNIHKMVRWCQRIIVDKTPISSHILGLLKINALKEFTVPNVKGDPLFRAAQIVNTYLKRDEPDNYIIDCQSDLIDADLEDFAQL